MLRFAALQLLVALGVLSASPAARADPAPLRVCYQARPVRGMPGATPVDGLAVTDRFGTRSVDLRRPLSLCEPAAVAGTGGAPDVLALEGLLAVTSRAGRRGGPAGIPVSVTNRFGIATLRVVALDRLLLPAATSPGPGGAARLGVPPPPALACWTARGPRVARRPPRVAVTDVEGERLLDVRRPRRLCVSTGDGPPAEMVCYAARIAPTRPPRQPAPERRVLSTAHALGQDVIRTGTPVELCVPSSGDAPPPPPGGSRLRIAPASVEVDFGLPPVFTATVVRDDGRPVEDATGRVAWRSSDESVAAWQSSAGGAFLVTRGPGVTTISAFDPVTGLDASTSGDEAALAVRWTLEKITISPHAVRKPVGGVESFTATGHFAHGVSRNLTQRVLWTTDDADVAVPPAAGARSGGGGGGASRITAIAPGSATISATDPISSLSSGDSGNDATLRVGRELEWIEIQTPGADDPGAFPGGSYRYVAAGHYSDGTSRTITEDVEWSSLDPAVAVATNPDGDRGRVDAVAPGRTLVHAVEPLTRDSAYAAFVTFGTLRRVEITPPAWAAEPLQLGERTSYLALGFYDPGTRDVTQELVWSTDDAAVAQAPNEAGRRSEVVAVGAGRTRVGATDPVTGVSSASSAFVLGQLVSLEAYPRRGTDLPVGSTMSLASLIDVLGIYENGSLLLSRSRPDAIVAITSDTAVAEIVDDGRTVHAVAPGIVRIGARHLATGIATAGPSVTVFGPLDRITLDPQVATRGIGESESFLALGHMPPGLTTRLTQRVLYLSSDPSVVVADNAPDNRSRVHTVGAGTATITAFDPVSGVSTHDTGDDAVLSVVPGTLDRITVLAPSRTLFPGDALSLTAVGHYPDGRTINVTQQVTWTSLDPDVVRASNPAGDRSRVVGVAPGTARVVATHPTGISSHASGDDAVVAVGPLDALALSPPAPSVRVGRTVRFTTTGTIGGGATVNLTQRVHYTVEWTPTAWDVARAYDRDGDRSAVVAVGPGQVTIRAYDAASGLSATATLTVIP